MEPERIKHVHSPLRVGGVRPVERLIEHHRGVAGVLGVRLGQLVAQGGSQAEEHQLLGLPAGQHRRVHIGVEHRAVLIHLDTDETHVPTRIKHGFLPAHIARFLRAQALN